MKERKMRSLTTKRVREVVDYSPETGDFVWKGLSRNRCVPGTLTGSRKGSSGELVIGIDGILCRGCCLAFLWMGEGLPPYVKYKDGDRRNTKWANLERSEERIAIVKKASGVKSSRPISSIFQRCPITGGRMEGTGVAKFNSLDSFFRVCCAKQGDTRMWETSKMGYKLVGKLHPKCGTCKQAKGSRSGEVVVDLEEIGVLIDESMGGL
jgi:hypothetical protein